MAAESDAFVIAMFAIWAGDFAYYEKLLRDFSPPHRVHQIDDAIESPEDILRDTGARRLRQFWQKRGEFRQLVARYGLQGIELTDQPAVVETSHLRGTIWRVGEREFVMQAYLKDLSWEESLFSRARAQAESLGTPKRLEPEHVGVEFAELEFEGESYRSRGRSWVTIGNPFVQIQLTELGLLEARSIWVERSLPAESESVTTPFLRILQSMDDYPSDERESTEARNKRRPK